MFFSTLNEARRQGRLYRLACKERNPDLYFDDVRAALQEERERGSIRNNSFDMSREFSLKLMFEHLVEDGREIVDSWNPRFGGSGVMLTEAGNAVSTSAFTNIMGQITYTASLDEFELPSLIGGQLTRNVPTVYDGEKIPGFGGVGDEAIVVNENDPYPTAGFAERWVNTTELNKRGFIIPISKEAVFFDRTGRIMSQVTDVSKYMAINKEKRILDCVTGVTTTFSYNGNANITTYGDVSGTHTWDNLVSSNALVNETDIDNVERAFDDITDPDTGEPVDFMGTRQLLHPRNLIRTVRRIRRFDTQESDPSAAENMRSGRLIDDFEPVTNQYVKERTGSTTTWFFGNFQKAFAYYENWPLTQVSAGPNAQAEFERDVIHQEKLSERGDPQVIHPWSVAKCTA